MSLRQRWNIADSNMRNNIRRLYNPLLSSESRSRLIREIQLLMKEKDDIAKEGFNELSDKITPGSGKARLERGGLRKLRGAD